MRGLTEKQNNFLKTLVEFRKKKGYPPTINELCGIFGVSIGTVQQYFTALERKGFIERENNKGRGLRVKAEEYSDSMPEGGVKIPVFREIVVNPDNPLDCADVKDYFVFPGYLTGKTKIFALETSEGLFFFSPSAKKLSGMLVWLDKNKFLVAGKERTKQAIPLGKVLFMLKKV